MVIQYKCPDCGADMKFDPEKGNLTCDSCGYQMPADEYQKTPEEPIQNFEEFEEETTAGVFEGEDALSYQCQNCGAVLMTDKDTSATTCSFCGAPMILSDRLTGDLRPAKLVPFTITKEQAQEAFRNWCRKGLLTPKGFMTADRIKNITGIYVPFWLYDLNGRGELHADCTKVRTYESGDYIYTETRYYDVYRKADLNYMRVPADASEKMDDKMMDCLEPYHYQDMVDFNMPYLAGYVAEKYNYTDKDLFSRVKQRIERYVDQYIRSTISGYSQTIVRNQWTEVKQRNAYYTLLPVWMICYDYKQAEHTFAMNGQTGKIVGKPPLSRGKIAAWFGGISAGIFLLLEIIYLVSGGAI